MYGHTDPVFEIAYRSTVDNDVHLLTVRACNLQDARDGFTMRCTPGATLIAARPAKENR